MCSSLFGASGSHSHRFLELHEVHRDGMHKSVWKRRRSYLMCHNEQVFVLCRTEAVTIPGKWPLGQTPEGIWIRHQAEGLKVKTSPLWNKSDVLKQ